MSLNLATRDTSAFGVLESQTRYNRSSQSLTPQRWGKQWNNKVRRWVRNYVLKPLWLNTIQRSF